MFRIVAILSIAGSLAACNDPTKPPADALVERDGGPTVDGSGVDSNGIDAAACTNPGDCPCFSNYDCPPTHACTSQGEMVSCVEGPRGTGAPGADCTGEADCASALCVENSTGGMSCSDICTMSDTCPPELPRCLGGIGICARNP